MTTYKSDFIKRSCTIQPNFIPIQFKTTEPILGFFEKGCRHNHNKTSSDMRSVPDPKIQLTVYVTMKILSIQE